MSSKRIVTTISLDWETASVLKQLTALFGESQTSAVRRTIRETAERYKLKPDPMDTIPDHIGPSSRERIKGMLGKGWDFEKAKWTEGFNPDWTPRND